MKLKPICIFTMARASFALERTEVKRIRTVHTKTWHGVCLTSGPNMGKGSLLEPSESLGSGLRSTYVPRNSARLLLRDSTVLVWNNCFCSLVTGCDLHERSLRCEISMRATLAWLYVWDLIPPRLQLCRVGSHVSETPRGLLPIFTATCTRDRKVQGAR